MFFVSLRFPDSANYPVWSLPPDPLLKTRLMEAGIKEENAAQITKHAAQVCPDPNVLSYRAEFAAELFSVPEAEQWFTAFSRFGMKLNPIRKHCHPETKIDLLLLTMFERFTEEFESLTDLSEQVPVESTAARRLFLYCRNLRESVDYREAKIRATEFRQKLGLKYGFSLFAPQKAKSVCLMKKEQTESDGIWQKVCRAEEEFGSSGLPYKVPAPSDPETERNTLCSLLEKDSKLTHAAELFREAYQAAEIDRVLQLSEEAELACGMNTFYRFHSSRNGYTVTRPIFRAPGFYSELFGLNYTSGNGGTAKADFQTSPLNHITVAFGPDAEAYLSAVRIAHLIASAGGLVFAERAEISPINGLYCDQNGTVSFETADEGSLCLCSHLFDTMLPRQEEAAACAVLRQLSGTNARSLVRICGKSNLSVLQKKSEIGILPPCTALQIGTDYTLEELLKRHRLTPQHLESEEEKNDDGII